MSPSTRLEIPFTLALSSEGVRTQTGPGITLPSNLGDFDPNESVLKMAKFDFKGAAAVVSVSQFNLSLASLLQSFVSIDSPL